MWSSDYGGAVSLRKSEARDAITGSSWGDGAGNKWRGVTRSSSYGCGAELGIGAAGWCGDQAMTGLLGWKRVRLRGWSGTKCGTVMRLSSCGCAVGAERSAAAVDMELG
jgi:hypothetical protein